MLKNVADAVLKELGIENDVPFQVNEWKDKDKDLWIKVTDGVSYWDAGTDRVNWYDDVVLLRQLMDGKLTVQPKKYRNVEMRIIFDTTSLRSVDKMMEIKQLINKSYESVKFNDCYAILTEGIS